jgi:hypothetical protein
MYKEHQGNEVIVIPMNYVQLHYLLFTAFKLCMLYNIFLHLII